MSRALTALTGQQSSVQAVLLPDYRVIPTVGYTPVLLVRQLFGTTGPYSPGDAYAPVTVAMLAMTVAGLAFAVAAVGFRRWMSACPRRAGCPSRWPSAPALFVAVITASAGLMFLRIAVTGQIPDTFGGTTDVAAWLPEMFWPLGRGPCVRRDRLLAAPPRAVPGLRLRCRSAPTVTAPAPTTRSGPPVHRWRNPAAARPHREAEWQPPG